MKVGNSVWRSTTAYSSRIDIGVMRMQIRGKVAYAVRTIVQDCYTLFKYSSRIASVWEAYDSRGYTYEHRITVVNRTWQSYGSRITVLFKKEKTQNLHNSVLETYNSVYSLDRHSRGWSREYENGALRYLPIQRFVENCIIFSTRMYNRRSQMLNCNQLLLNHTSHVSLFNIN